jgi:hypothetical protein
MYRYRSGTRNTDVVLLVTGTVMDAISVFRKINSLPIRSNDCLIGYGLWLINCLGENFRSEKNIYL